MNSEKKEMWSQSLLLLKDYSKTHLRCALEFTKHMHVSVILRGSTRKKRLNPFPRGVNCFAPRSHRAIHGRALVPTQTFTVQGPTYPHWMDGWHTPKWMCSDIFQGYRQTAVKGRGLQVC